MRRKAVSWALAALLLAAQLAAAAHLAVPHPEEISTCGEASSHFCAETPQKHEGPCALCRVGAERIVALGIGVSPAPCAREPLAVPPEAGLTASPDLSTAPARAPPAA